MTKKLLFLLATLLIAAGMSLAQGTGTSGSSSNPSDQTGVSSSSQTSTGSAGQSGSSTSGSEMGTQGSAGATSSQGSSSGSMGASGQAGTTASTESSGKMKGEKTLKGCIESSGAGQYTLAEKGGKSVTLSSTEDLSAHVGHEVKVHGSYSGSSASATSSGSSANANAGETFSVTKVDMVSEQCKIKGASSSSTPPSGK